MFQKILVVTVLFLSPALWQPAMAFKAKAVSVDFEEKLNEIKEDSARVLFLLKFSEKYQLSDQVLSLEYGLRAYQIAEINDFEESTIASLELITRIFLQNQMYLKAYEYEKKLIDKLEKANRNMASHYLVLSSILFSTGKPSAGEQWAEKALEQMARTQDSVSLSQATLTTAVYLYKSEYYNKALNYFDRCLSYFISTDDKSYMAMAYNYLGKIYFEQTNYQQALENFLNSLYLYQELKAGNGEAMLCNDIAQAYLAQGDYNNAITYARYALQNLSADDQLLIRTESNNVLSISYASLGNYKKAYAYEIEFEKNNREYLLNQNKQNLSRGQRIDELNNVLLSLQLRQEKMSELNQAREKAETTTAILVGASILVIATLMLLLTICQVRTRKLRAELKRNSQKMHETLQELDKMNATRNKFFAIISHDLKNPFNALLGFSNLLYTEYDEFSDIEKKKFIKQIYEASDSINKLLNNLLQWAKTQSGIIRIKKEALNLSTIVGNLIPLVKAHADSKNIRIKSKIKSDSPVYADANMISTVIRNLVTNAIKFTPEYGEIVIDTQYNGKFVEVSVEDNGMGMDEAVAGTLFGNGEDSAISSLKMINSGDKNGLGLILCKEFVAKNGGKIWVESKMGKGSSFRFTLPLSSN